jgi:hypothetical protein
MVVKNQKKIDGKLSKADESRIIDRSNYLVYPIHFLTHSSEKK